MPERVCFDGRRRKAVMTTGPSWIRCAGRVSNACASIIAKAYAREHPPYPPRMRNLASRPKEAPVQLILDSPTIPIT